MDFADLQQRTVRSARIIILAAAAIVVSVALGAVRSAAAADPPTQVELSCKIESASAGQGGKFWILEVRKATGEAVSRRTAVTNDTLRFKNLQPGIYVLCLRGDNGRQKCESVDLVPPAGQPSYRFLIKLQTAMAGLHQRDSFRVSRLKLSVPQGAREELERSEQARFRGEFEESVRRLKRAIEIFPSYSDALNNLGTHYHRSGQYQLAIQQFVKATELDPELYAGWVNLGGSLMAIAEFGQALEALKKAFNLRPNDPLVNSQLAIDYFYLHDYAEAKKYFKKVLELDPVAANSPQLFLAHIALSEKNEPEAEGYIRSFLALHPNSPHAPRLRNTLETLASKSQSGSSMGQAQP